MSDILTTSAASTAALSLPFDWSVVPAGPVKSVTWHDYSNPCVAPAARVEALEIRALALDDGLCTAVVLSMFCDRRADDDVTLPLNQTDRRGWCGDEFMGDVDTDAPIDASDAWGSHLWLCYVSKSVVPVLERARFAVQESLQWMVKSGVVDRLVVDAEWTGPVSDRLAVRPQLWRGDSIKPIYDVLWGTTLRRIA